MKEFETLYAYLYMSLYNLKEGFYEMAEEQLRNAISEAMDTETKLSLKVRTE